MHESHLISCVDHLMNYMTVLARLYIIFVMGINLESSLALWVIFLGISLPFLGSCSLWFTALFGIVSFPSGFARLHGIVQYHFLLSLSLAHSLSRSSWLLLSLLILLFQVRSLRNFINSVSATSPLWGWATENHENKFSLISVMAAMLGDSEQYR